MVSLSDLLQHGPHAVDSESMCADDADQLHHRCAGRFLDAAPEVIGMG